MSGSGGVNSLQTVDGKTVIVVEVSEDRQHPYYIKALGRDGGEVTSRASFFTILHGLWRSQNLHKIISTHLLIMEVDFCPVLCILEVPVLQAFRGISHFVWYCKAVSDLS